MNEKDMKLLMMALSMGWKTVSQIRDALDYCEDARNDYYLMVEKLSEKLGVDLTDATN